MPAATAWHLTLVVLACLLLCPSQGAPARDACKDPKSGCLAGLQLSGDDMKIVGDGHVSILDEEMNSEVFKLLDENGDEFVDAKELPSVKGKLNKQGLQDLLLANGSYMHVTPTAKAKKSEAKLSLDQIIEKVGKKLSEPARSAIAVHTEWYTNSHAHVVMADKVFGILDINNDGVLDVGELEGVPGGKEAVGQKRDGFIKKGVDWLFSFFDGDKDKKISTGELPASLIEYIENLDNDKTNDNFVEKSELSPKATKPTKAAKQDKPKKEGKPTKEPQTKDREAKSSAAPDATKKPDIKDAEAEENVDTKNSAPKKDSTPGRQPTAAEIMCGKCTDKKNGCKSAKGDGFECLPAYSDADPKLKEGTPKPATIEHREVDGRSDQTLCGLCYWETDPWGKWSDCQKGCGESKQTQTRKVRCLKSEGGKVTEVHGEAQECCRPKNCKQGEGTPRSTKEQQCTDKSLCNYYCKEFEWTDWEPSPKDAAVNERVRFRKVQCTEKHKGARVDETDEECKKLNCAGIETKEIEKAKPSDAIWVEDNWGKWENPRNDVCGPYQKTRTRRVACENPDGTMQKDVNQCNKWRKKPDSRDADDSSRTPGMKPEDSMLNSRDELINKGLDTPACMCKWVKTAWNPWSNCEGDAKGCQKEERIRKAKCIVGPKIKVEKADYDNDLGLAVEDRHCCGDGDKNEQVTKEEFVTYFHWLHTEYKAGEKHASTVATTVATTMATTIATTVFEAHSLPQNTEKRTEKFIDDVEKRTPGKDKDDSKLSAGEIEESMVHPEKFDEQWALDTFEHLDKDGNGFVDEFEISKKGVRVIENHPHKTKCCASESCTVDLKSTCRAGASKSDSRPAAAGQKQGKPSKK